MLCANAGRRSFQLSGRWVRRPRTPARREFWQTSLPSGRRNATAQRIENTNKSTAGVVVMKAAGGAGGQDPQPETWPACPCSSRAAGAEPSPPSALRRGHALQCELGSKLRRVWGLQGRAWQYKLQAGETERARTQQRVPAWPAQAEAATPSPSPSAQSQTRVPNLLGMRVRGIAASVMRGEATNRAMTMLKFPILDFSHFRSLAHLPRHFPVPGSQQSHTW